MNTKDEALEHLKAGFTSLSQICMAILDRDEQLEHLVRDYQELADRADSNDGLYPPGWHEERDALQQRKEKLLEEML